MPKNVAIPFFKAGKDVTGEVATAPVTGMRFVAVVPGGRPLAPKIDPAAAGELPFGVAGHDMTVGGHVHVLREGIVPVVATGDLTAGTRVEVGENGTAAALDAGAPVGVCTANAASGTPAAIALSL